MRGFTRIFTKGTGVRWTVTTHRPEHILCSESILSSKVLKESPVFPLRGTLLTARILGVLKLLPQIHRYKLVRGSSEVKP